MDYDAVISRLKKYANPKAVEGMRRFGIKAGEVLGVSIPNIRKIAKEIGVDHELAVKLWSSSCREYRILSCMIDDAKLVSELQLERMVSDFDSWEVCDQCCTNLLKDLDSPHQRAIKWSKKEEEFAKRAGYALMAVLAVHDKKSSDNVFEGFFKDIIRGSTDERNFVKKAVNWAIRQIGKKNMSLNQKCIKLSEELLELDSKSAKWIAKDAIKELTDEKILKRIKDKMKKK
ncbi:MAG: DNA alkylation repair protein [Candidatus Ranarchaeia archaeon]